MKTFSYLTHSAFKSWHLALVLLLGLLATAPLKAKPSSEDALSRANQNYQLANGAYEKNEYASAADLYRKAIDEGVADSHLYFNYANCLFRLNQLGMSLLYMEKAHKLNPDDEDIGFNLRFINAQIVDKNPIVETNFLTKMLWFLHSSYSINQGLWICLGVFAGIFLIAIGILFAGSAIKGILYTLLALLLLAEVILMPSVIYKIKQQESLQYAIVLKPAIEMFSGPGESFQVLTKVHEGTKFEIVETRDEWVSVKLANGKGGFVRLSELGKI